MKYTAKIFLIFSYLLLNYPTQAMFNQEINRLQPAEELYSKQQLDQQFVVFKKDLLTAKLDKLSLKKSNCSFLGTCFRNFAIGIFLTKIVSTYFYNPYTTIDQDSTQALADQVSGDLALGALYMYGVTKLSTRFITKKQAKIQEDLKKLATNTER